MIKETTERLKETLAQSDTGHLPLSCRINLMQEIGDALTVQKIMCECCKRQYCKLLKQSRYEFGMKAKAIKLRRQMPRERMAWTDDGNRYITRGFAGYFVYGEWRQADVDEWQGTFVADLRVTPLQPVKQRKSKINYPPSFGIDGKGMPYIVPQGAAAGYGWNPVCSI